MGPFEPLRGYVSEMSAEAVRRETLAHQLPPGTGQGGAKGSNSLVPPGCPRVFWVPHQGLREAPGQKARSMRCGARLGIVGLPLGEAGLSLHWMRPGNGAWSKSVTKKVWRGTQEVSDTDLKSNWFPITVIYGLGNFNIVSCPGPRLQISWKETPATSPVSMKPRFLVTFCPAMFPELS